MATNLHSSIDTGNAHAIQLARVAFSIPYGDEGDTIDALLMLSQLSRAMQKLLTVLVLAGEIIASEMILDAGKALLEASKTKQ